MRTLIVFLLALSFAPPVRAEARSPPSEAAKFRRWIVHYLKSDHEDDDLHNLVYGFALVDLNGDGRKEAVVWSRDQFRCGSGGCELEIFVHDQSAWRLFSTTEVTRPPIMLLPTRTRGWRDLSAWEAGGGIERPYEAPVRFDGTEYSISWPADFSGRKPPSLIGGIVLIQDATIPLFPSKCRPTKEQPSVFGPMPIPSGPSGSCGKNP